MARKSRKAGTIVSKSTVSAEYKYKVAIYARLSHEKEESIERGTIENQVSFINEYVGRHDDMKVVETYVDDSFSGSNFDRPGYLRMIADMKDKKFNTIVVKDLSRLGREYVQVGNLIERVFPIYGVRFIAILDNYDSLSSDAGIMMPVANIANTLYAQDISKKIISSKHVKMEKGIPVGKAPFGYKIIIDENGNRKMVIDEVSGKIIRRFVELFLSGLKMAEIVRIFNEEGIPTPYRYQYRNKPEILERKPNLGWSTDMLNHIINNPVYRGTYIAGKESMCLYRHEKRRTVPKEEWIVIENNHEALITEEEYKEKLKNKPKHRKTKRREENYLGGIIRCGKCGSAMNDWTDHGTKRYYVCGRKARYGAGVCDCKNYPKEKAYQTVLQVIKEEMQELLDLDIVLEKLNHSKEADRHIKMLNGKIQASKLEITKTASLKSSLYVDLRDGLINEDEYRVLTTEYSERLETLNGALKEYERILEDTKQSPLDRTEVKALIDKYKRKRNLSREMVDALVKEVFVNDGELEVVLKFNDKLLKLSELIDERRAWKDEN